MLCQFTFKNYRSYRDEATLDMQASPVKEFPESLIPGGDSQSFLPVAAVYGPNAGGKSNLLAALGYVVSAVSMPIFALTQDGGAPSGMPLRLSGCSPFAFDDRYAGRPVEFELYFRASGGEYRYYLAVRDSEIVGESLYRRKIGAARAAMLYEREGAEVLLGASLRRKGVSVSFNTAIPYLSFLYMNTDVEIVKAAAEWFMFCIYLDYNELHLESALENLLSEDELPKVTKFLRAVDVHVDGFRIERDDESNQQRIYVRHDVGGNSHELRFREESAGTKKLAGLARIVMFVLRSGGLVIVDELDAKLHPKLLRYVIKLFTDPDVNKGRAQLVFTSQDVSTMRNDVFRRDEIWFAAREDGEASRLWSLSDLREPNGNPVNKNAAFDKQYLAGRYGADPYLTRIEGWE